MHLKKMTKSLILLGFKDGCHDRCSWRCSVLSYQMGIKAFFHKIQPTPIIWHYSGADVLRAWVKWFSCYLTLPCGSRDSQLRGCAGTYSGHKLPHRDVCYCLTTYWVIPELLTHIDITLATNYNKPHHVSIILQTKCPRLHCSGQHMMDLLLIPFWNHGTTYITGKRECRSSMVTPKL